MKRYTFALVVEVPETAYGPEGTLDMLFEHGMQFYDASWSVQGEIAAEDVDDA